ncbi:hypothetical protein N24_1775 [Corynebacterium suranareeae]|uniref:Uncharacterized protein n=1 Tax=Corynebacterium suranareeae TaxID=2506452 RepID=A0A160PPS3_9CORY|nr:hypothetical protein [Corynebacterium suranareeae]BAU96037.1 hypothetical protein N24_1775 [Corynebacterium suranareeae]
MDKLDVVAFIISIVAVFVTIFATYQTKKQMDFAQRDARANAVSGVVSALPSGVNSLDYVKRLSVSGFQGAKELGVDLCTLLEAYPSAHDDLRESLITTELSNWVVKPKSKRDISDLVGQLKISSKLREIKPVLDEALGDARDVYKSKFGVEKVRIVEEFEKSGVINSDDNYENQQRDDELERIRLKISKDTHLTLLMSICGEVIAHAQDGSWPRGSEHAFKEWLNEAADVWEARIEGTDVEPYLQQMGDELVMRYALPVYKYDAVRTFLGLSTVNELKVRLPAKNELLKFQQEE